MEPQFTSVSVVLLGRFIPQAFMPDALREANVLSADEATRARIKTLVNNDALEFSLPWIDVLITSDRFQVVTSEAPYIRVCDFATKALNDVHSDYVVNAFGVNVDSHFNLGSTEKRDELGKRLAPPAAWGSWGKVIASNMHGATAKENPLHGGLVLLQMRQQFLDEELSGWLDIWVGLSGRIEANTGVRLRSNHHHFKRPQENSLPSEDEKAEIFMLTMLAKRFDDSVVATEHIFREVIGQ